MEKPKPKSAEKKERRRTRSGEYKPTPRHVTNWARIREEYENTDASIAELCKRFSIPQRTTIVRRRDREQWTRNIKAIAADIATSEILAENEAMTRADPRARGQQIQVLDPCEAEALGPAQSNYGTPGRDRRTQALALAKIQREQVRQEQDVAELGMLVSAKVLRALDTILSDDDPARVSEAADRLGKISKNTESFSSLLRASIGSFKDAVALRRRAVGLDTPRLPVGANGLPAQPSEIPDEIARVLPNLDIDSLEQLRVISEKLEKMRTIDGTTA